MNSTSHLIISVVKSVIRIGSCALAFSLNSIMPIAIGFAFAEILGILEELVDER